MNKKNNKIYFGYIIGIIIIILVSLIYFFKNNFSIKVILENKYDEVKCYNNCKKIVSYKGNNIKVYNYNGLLISKLKIDNKEKIIRINDNYILTSKKEDKKTTYYIKDLKNKIKYYTKNELIGINNYLLYEQKESKFGDLYDLYDYSGKRIVSDLNEIDFKLKRKFIYANKDDHSYLFNEKGKNLFTDYNIIETNNNFIILNSNNNKLYYYYNIKNNTLIEDGFNKYIINDDNSVEVLKKFNNNEEYKLIKNNGKLVSIKNDNSIFNRIKTINDSFDNNYKLYESSVLLNNKSVLVDDVNSNSFGIYNVSKKEFTSIYNYRSKTNISEINELRSFDNNKRYVQIACNVPICKKNYMYVYDLIKSKVVFNTTGSDLLAEEFTLYKNNYKVVYYSRNSENKNYKGKYVLYDKNNKELIKDNKPIILIGSTPILGALYNNSLIYDINSKKIINEKSLAKVYDNKYIIYSNKIINLKGNNIYTFNKYSKVKKYDNYFYIINNNKIKMFDLNKMKVYSYNKKSNESIYGNNNEFIDPLNDNAIVNNKNYIKVINVKNGNIKLIKKNSIYKIINNNGKSYIITNKGKKYGLVILK